MTTRISTNNYAYRKCNFGIYLLSLSFFVTLQCLTVAFYQIHIILQRFSLLFSSSRRSLTHPNRPFNTSPSSFSALRSLFNASSLKFKAFSSPLRASPMTFNTSHRSLTPFPRSLTPLQHLSKHTTTLFSLADHYILG